MLLVEVISKTYLIQLPRDTNVCCVLTCNARIFLTLKLNVAPVSTLIFMALLYALCYITANETKQLCKEEFSVIKKVKESADLDYESLASVLVQRYTHTMYCTLFKKMLITIYRPTWLSYSGCKYTASYYVLVGWQDNDLPIFGKIKFIAVIEDKVLFCVHEYHTEGLDRHYHSFVLGRESKECVYWLSEIPSCRPFIGHRVSNYSYITFHSHVEK